MKLLRLLAALSLTLGALLVTGCSSQQPTASASATASAAPPPPLTAAELKKLPGWSKWMNKKDPLPDNAATLARAKAIFQDPARCASCHGVDGKGDGPGAIALRPLPRNFTLGEYRFGSENWQIFRTIWDGVPPPSGMAAWKGRLSKDDAWALVYYVKSLGPSSPTH